MMSRTFVPGSMNECHHDFEMGTSLQLRPEYRRDLGERSMRQFVASHDSVPGIHNFRLPAVSVEQRLKQSHYCAFMGPSQRGQYAIKWPI